MYFAPNISIVNRIAAKGVFTIAIKLAVMAAGKRVTVCNEKTSAKEAATMVPKKSAGTSKPAEPPEPIVIKLAVIFASNPIKARPKANSSTKAN